MAITKINTPELFDLGTTNSSLRLPSGNTASRPSNPNTGEWRYNTDDNYVEYWDGTDWFQIDYETVAPTCTTNTINYPTAVTAYYKMEDATDQTGNYNGTATSVDFNVAGKFGNAGEFDGSSSYIALPDNAFNFTTLTVSVWINVTTFNGEKWIFDGYDEIPGLGKGFAVTTHTGDKVKFRAWGTGFSEVISNTVLSTNTWYNVTCVATQSEAKVYINGSLDNTGSLTGIQYASTQNYGLGAVNITGTPSGHFTGKIDQVRIFPTALDADKVTQLYNEVQCAPTIVPSEHFNVNTYVGNGSTQTIDAKFNEAAVFNGSSSNIVLSKIPTLTSNVSVSGWFNLGNTTSSSRLRAFSLNSVSGYGGTLEALYRPSDGQWVVRVGNGTSSDTNVLTHTYQLTQSTWYHICFTRDDSTNITKFYINGSEQDGETVSATATIQSNAISVIGNQPSLAAATTWNGKIDQVRIFDTALTGPQVTDLYTNETDATAQLLNFPVGAGCVAAYELDGDASDVGKTYGGIPTDIGYTGLQFAPDLVWIKNRDYSPTYNLLFDSVRGATNWLSSNATAQEGTIASSLTSFDSNGFSLGADPSGSDEGWNINGDSHVAWNWKAGGAPTATNSAGAGNVPTAGSVKIDGADSTTALAGTIAATSISANTDAGFSIVSYTGAGTTATVGHGLSSTVELLIVKGRETTNDWAVLDKDNADGNFLQLNNNAAQSGSGGIFGSPTARPTDSVFTIGNAGETGTINKDYIAYCFHSVEGFSKIGSYIGTNAPNNYIVTGFEPAFVMIKSTGATNGDWNIFDNKRNTPNPLTDVLKANTDGTETTEAALNINFNSNGFTLNGASNAGGRGQINSSGITYIFLAIAADPAPEPVLANSFDPVIWTGQNENLNRSISGVGFQPDLVWVKARTYPWNHQIYDSVRGAGANKAIHSNDVLAEGSGNEDQYGYLSSFDVDGFTGSVGTSTNEYFNTSGYNMVAWCWKAAGIPAINQNGTIDSIVSANPAAGFSIVKYTANATSGATIGHGLNQELDLLIVKSTNLGQAWNVYVKDVTDTSSKYLRLNETSSISDLITANPRFIPNNFTDSVFSVGNDNSTNGISGTDQYIAYCFHSVAGHSKIGSYQGTGLAGNFVSTSVGGDAGFEPKFVMIKSSSNPEPWFILDAARDTSNPRDNRLMADSSAAETDGSVHTVDFTSTGFTANSTVGNGTNGAGVTYIYLAIA